MPLILGRQAAPRQAALHPDPKLPFKMASMQGLGDNLHQRAIVRQLMQRNTVYLDTPWPSIYHDLVGPKLQLVRPVATTLRTQAKNVRRELGKYQLDKFPRQVQMVRTWYTGDDVRKHGSILAAMLANSGCQLEGSDFRLPIPDAWRAPVWHTDKPLMLYRPLVMRTEWQGCAGRNPQFAAYREIFDAIREQFYVVSVADLVPGKEWLADGPVRADLELHSGELTFEALAALAKRSALVFCSAGFAPLLAQAVGTPVICVFGGHESSMTIKDGARFAPTLGIDPIVPCNCFDHKHAHRKEIDIPAAIERVNDFVYYHVHRRIEDANAAASRLESALARHRLAHPPAAVHESGRAGDAGGAGAQRERQGGA